MSNRNVDANYFKIGSFVIVGIAIIILAFLIFGSHRLFERTVYLETYFDESVQGISIGTPVKYRGLQIGYVKDISFTSEVYRFHEKSPLKLQNRTIFVKLAITSKLFTELSDKEISELLATEVAAGLRVKLAMQGLTGTSYLELNYVEVNNKNNKPFTPHWKTQNLYIPSATSTISQLSENVQQILSELKDVDFKKIFDDVDGLTNSLNVLSGNADNYVAKISDPSVATLNSLRAVSNSLRALVEHIKPAPSQLLLGGTPPQLDLNKL